MDDFKNSLGNVDILEKWVDEEIRIILKRARMVCAVYWAHRDQLIENYFEGMQPVLGCRVQNKGFVAMSWFSYRFYKPKSMNGKAKRYSQHITKPKGSYKYTLSKLYRHANVKQYEVIEYCESNFAELREKLEKLRKLKIWIVAYKN